jgi:6-phosphogluconolactonase (cycloisomerase 2 family)
MLLLIKFKKILKSFGRATSKILIVLLIVVWLFAGWPVIWKNLKIKEAKAQGINVKVGSFAKITTTGTQTITGLGFQPKAIIFYWSRNTANATAAVPRSQGVGFTDCTNQRAVAIAEDDNANTSNAGRYRTESNVIVILSNGNPTVGSRATFTSCNADGFTINWAVSEARADIINYIAIGGPDVTNVKAGTFTLAAATGIQNITGVGFQPDFAMFLWGFTENVDTASAGLEMGMGFADYGNNQGSILNCVQDNQANNSTKYSQQRTDNVILLSSLTCAQDALAAFNGFTADGFRLNVSDAPAAATPIFYLAIKGGSHAVGNFLQPTATGVQTISGTGFQPNLVVLFSRNQAAGTTLTAPSTFSIGAANATTSRAGVWGQSRNVDPSNAAVYTDNTKIIIMRTLSGTGGTGTINAQADFAGFTSDGFQLNWTTVDTTQRQIIYWAFGPSPTFNQSAYRFFNNLDSTNVGAPLADQNTAATLTSAGQAFRLRLLLHVGSGKLILNGQSFKLQFAQRGADGLCDTAFTGETYADVTTTTVIAFNDNPTPTDGSALTATTSDPTHGADTIVNQTYEELNPFTNSVAAISSGQDGKWDFSLKDNGAPANTTYCFRVVLIKGISSASYNNASTSVAAQEIDPTGIFFKPDGTKMFIVGTVADTVFQYSLTTPWDITTASYDNVNFYVGGQEATPRGVAFSSDGTKMYITGETSDKVHQYDLTTPWNVGTATYNNASTSVLAQTTSVEDLTFSSDGTKMYIVSDLTNGRIFQYSLATPWDITTASYDNVVLDVNGQDSRPRGVVFTNDGRKMYMVGELNDRVYEYDLSTPWNIATASFSNTFLPVGSQDTLPLGLALSTDTTKMYVIGSTGDKVYEYDTNILLNSYTVIPQITTAAAPAITCTLSATSTSFSALSPSAVSTSSPDITITITSSGGFQINVRDNNGTSTPGLYKSTSPTYLIQSQDATLSAGTDGYGIQATTTNASVSINSKYNKSGNDVGGLSLTDVVLATSSVAVSNATINIKHKASVSVLAPTGSYQDTITYTCSAL